MVPIRGELLFPTRVFRYRICAANIAGHDPRAGAKNSKRPLQILDGKPPVLPIGSRVFCAQTIQIDRDVNIGGTQIGRELFEFASPGLLQNRARTFLVLDRTIIGPGMDFESAAALPAAIGENIVRPPAFEIPAPPNRDMPDVRQFERAIDPPATSPFRRRDRPVRMIIERNKDPRFGPASEPKRAQIMKIARAVENKRREPRFDIAIKLFDDSRGRAETQFGSPLARIQHGQLKRRIPPRVIEVNLKRAVQK